MSDLETLGDKIQFATFEFHLAKVNFEEVQRSAVKPCASRRLFYFFDPKTSTMDIDSDTPISSINKGKGKQIVAGDKDNLPW